jgi:hypothetical protein
MSLETLPKREGYRCLDILVAVDQWRDGLDDALADALVPRECTDLFFVYMVCFNKMTSR